MSLEWDETARMKVVGLADDWIAFVAEQIMLEAQVLTDDPFPPASVPGQPPHRRTGDLHEGIAVHKVDDCEYAVYTDAEEGLYMEVGTLHVAPRPWLSAATDNVKSRLKGPND